MFEMILDHLIGDRSVPDFLDDTAMLETVAVGGPEEMVRYFLDRGANASHISQSEESGPSNPVSYAVLSGNTRILRMLVDAGAGLATPVSVEGATTLHIAAGNTDDIAMVEELLNLGADVSWIDYEQMSYSYCICKVL